MYVYSLASRLNSVQIEVKSKASKNNPTFTGNITANGNIKGGIGEFHWIKSISSNII